MGFSTYTPALPRALALHAALREATPPDHLIEMQDWFRIVARCIGTATRKSSMDYAEAMDAWGLIKWHKGQGVQVLHVDPPEYLTASVERPR